MLHGQWWSLLNSKGGRDLLVWDLCEEQFYQALLHGSLSWRLHVLSKFVELCKCRSTVDVTATCIVKMELKKYTCERPLSNHFKLTNLH